MKDVFTPLYLDTYLNKEKFEISIFDGNKDKYEFNLYFQYDTSILKGRVAVIRTIGMKIEDRKILNCATKPFNAVLIPKDSDGDSFLKSLENESHSELSVDHIKDSKEQKNSKKFLNNLSTEIRKILDDFIRKNNPVDGKIDTKDIIYDVENKFKTELKANTNFLDLQQQLGSIENEIQMSRRYYNGTARNLNTAIQRFPAVLIARQFGFKEAPFFEAEEGSRENPKVSF